MPEQLPLAAMMDPEQLEVPKAVPPPWPDDCPEPGIYEDIPYETYASWRAVNASLLKVVSVSMAHVKFRWDGRDLGDSQDRKLGRAIHCRLLEPHRYAEDFPTATLCCEPLKSGPRKGQECGSESSMLVDGQWFCKTHAKAHPGGIEPADYVRTEQAGRIEHIAEAVLAHDELAVLRSHGGSETCVVWEREGIPCKCRFDKFLNSNPDEVGIVDIKKCQPFCATDEKIQRDIHTTYSWDVQAAFYSDAAHAVTGKTPHFWFVFCEDGPPYEVRLVPDDGTITGVGRIRAATAFNAVRRALCEDTWPGYSSEPLGAPDYLIKRYEL